MDNDDIVVGPEYAASRKARNQELFNTSWRTVKAQGFKRAYGSEMCMYRHTDTLGNTYKCAFGGHIPDDIYTPDIERCVVTGMHDHIRGVCSDLNVDNTLSETAINERIAKLDAYNAWFTGAFDDLDRAVLREHQRLHDDNSHPYDMRAAFVYYAGRHGLTIPADEEVAS